MGNCIPVITNDEKDYNDFDNNYYGKIYENRQTILKEIKEKFSQSMAKSR